MGSIVKKISLNTMLYNSGIEMQIVYHMHGLVAPRFITSLKINVVMVNAVP